MREFGKMKNREILVYVATRMNYVESELKNHCDQIEDNRSNIGDIKEELAKRLAIKKEYARVAGISIALTSLATLIYIIFG